MIAVITYLCTTNTQQTSRKVHEHIEETYDISRPSVIIFLQRLRDEELILYEAGHGKGGEHGIYWCDLSLSGFWSEVKRRVLHWMSEGEQQYLSLKGSVTK